MYSIYLVWKVHDKDQLFFGSILFIYQFRQNLIFLSAGEVRQEASPFFGNPEPLRLHLRTFVSIPSQGSETDCFLLTLAYT